MAITTTFDSEHFLTSSIQIYKEWLQDYISNVDMTDDAPLLNDNYSIGRVLIYFQQVPGSYISISNRHIGDGKKLVVYQPEWYLNFITSLEIGGMNPVRQLVETIKYNTINTERSSLLGAAGLKQITCGGLREFPQNDSSPFYGGRLMVTYRCSVIY